jgi:hypothetical protein
MRRRTLLVGLGSVAGAAGAVGSGAFTSVSARRDVEVRVADDADALLRLVPADGPNGRAFADSDDGVLALDLSSTDAGGEGVGVDSVYDFDDVFEIENRGTQTVSVWLTVDFAGTALSRDDLWFYPNGDSSTRLDDGTNSVATVPVGGSLDVGLHVDTASLAATGRRALPTTVHADASQPTPSDGVVDGVDPSRSSLVAEYPLDGDALDASGNGFDGSVTNQGSFVDGAVGRAVSFDGSDGYVAVPDADGLDGFDGGLTVSAWANFSGTGDAANTLVRKEGAYILQRTSDDDVSFAVWSDGGLTDWKAARTRAFGPADYGTWFHLAGVFDPTGPEYRLYLDGTLVDSASTTATGVDASAEPLTLGGYDTVFSLDGRLDEVRVYERPLTSTEVAVLATR